LAQRKCIEIYHIKITATTFGADSFVLVGQKY